MVDKKIVKEWVSKGQEDFDFASANLEDQNNAFFSQICFHFQQAAEKYLKAYITAYELEFKKIHDLLELLRICQEHNPPVQDIKNECEFLTDFYVETRYPVHWPTEITRQETQKAKNAAQKIGSYIKILLKEFLEQ